MVLRLTAHGAIPHWASYSFHDSIRCSCCSPADLAMPLCCQVLCSCQWPQKKCSYPNILFLDFYTFTGWTRKKFELFGEVVLAKKALPAVGRVNSSLPFAYLHFPNVWVWARRSWYCSFEAPWSQWSCKSRGKYLFVNYPNTEYQFDMLHEQRSWTLKYGRTLYILFFIRRIFIRTSREPIIIFPFCKHIMFKQNFPVEGLFNVAL